MPSATSGGPRRTEAHATEQSWKDAIAAADKFSAPYNNEFGQIVEGEGGEGMNAYTDYDETEYHYSFPINRLELWAYLESERFLHPVLRQFYKERNVVIEERRMRVDSNPVGRLLEQFSEEAFAAHPYHRPTIGWTIGLEFFFGDRRAELLRQVLRSVEHGGCRGGRREGCGGDANYGEVFFADSGSAQARYGDDDRAAAEFRAAAWCCTSSRSRCISKAIIGPITAARMTRCMTRSADLMSNGRTSRLYRALVRDKQIASDAEGFTGYAGEQISATVRVLRVAASGAHDAGSGRCDSCGD